MLINVLMYALMVYLMFRMFRLSKRNKKNQQLIKMVNTIEDEAFFDNCDDYINTIQDTVFENKARIIKLWGMTYKHTYYGFEQLLEDINIDCLFNPKTGGIAENEDSFFYMYLAIPNMLYADNEIERKAMVFEKLAPYTDRLNSELSKVIGLCCEKYYQNEGDRGEEFYKKVIDGDYGGYKYSKSLIGLYKMICNAMLIKICSERGEDISEYDGLFRSFAQTGVGKRWCKAIDLELPAEEEPEEPADEPEPDAEAVPEETETETEKKEEE